MNEKDSAIVESITTLNLLLTLGNNLVELVKGLRGIAPSQAKEREIRDLVHGMAHITEQHTQIQQVLGSLKGGMEHILQNGPQSIAPLCTPQGYEQVRALFHAYRTHSVLRHTLNNWELLGVELLQRTGHPYWHSVGAKTKYEAARAYTRSQWTTSFLSGENASQEVVNCYELLHAKGEWKVNRIEIFRREV